MIHLFIWVGWHDWQSFFDDELTYLLTYLLTDSQLRNVSNFAESLGKLHLKHYLNKLLLDELGKAATPDEIESYFYKIIVNNHWDNQTMNALTCTFISNVNTENQIKLTCDTCFNFHSSVIKRVTTSSTSHNIYICPLFPTCCILSTVIVIDPDADENYSVKHWVMR